MVKNAAAPLAGVTVIDASTHLAGPFAGLMLADLGASVIKVEPLPGDPLRNYTGPQRSVGQLAASVNRNKRSIALDLKSEQHKANFLRLLSTADILLHNWRLPVERKLGLEDDVVAGVNDRLVRVAITGFGPTGPRADEPAFDAIIQALTGLAIRQGGPAGPAMVRTYIADKTAAMFAVQAALAALVRRGVTGTGVRIDVPMLDALGYSNFPDLFEGSIFLDRVAEPEEEQVLRTTVPTADGHVVVAPGSGHQLKQTLAVAGHPEWKDELVAIPERETMVSRLLDLLSTVLPAAPSQHWIDQFRAAGVPCAPVLDVFEHREDRQVRHNGTYRTYAHPAHGEVLAAQYPARFRGLEHVEPTPFPEIGEFSSL